MLFNSPEFIFVFLPAAVMLHFLLARHSIAAACITTTVTSLIFYLWWRPPFVLLPVLSILINFALASWIVRTDAMSARRLMILGIAANLAVLIYFKYAEFLLSIVTGLPAGPPKVPLALSFTTFVQIAFLVDVYNRREAARFEQYSMFVAFFPHLIAGPIVRWTELGPQIEDRSRYRVDWNNVALGLTIFLFGLAKKLLIADPLGEFVAPVFDAAARGEAVTTAAAWGGALAYSCQLYFDFSGYSEMAIGLGLLFNLRLPINFAAPFRSTSIIDFWRRWHVTLSRFLRDFVYVPLGGSRRGPSRTAVNLVATMTIGGLWHGAGWTFIAWGAWNGVLLAINHAWRQWRGPPQPTRFKTFASWLATFIAFVIGMVFFRATDMPSAVLLLKNMAGIDTAAAPAMVTLQWDVWGIRRGYLSETFILQVFGATWTTVGTVWMLIAVAIALFAPETIEWMNYREGEPHSAWRRPMGELSWRPSAAWLVVSVALFAGVFYQINRVSEFLYYQF
jgi:alginate O-acetyltransferase complex protein AlgI